MREAGERLERPGTARAGGMEGRSQPAARAATARRTQFTSDAKGQRAERVAVAGRTGDTSRMSGAL